MSKSTFGLYGELTLWKHDKSGNLVEKRGPYHNTVTTAGFSQLCKVVGSYLTIASTSSWRWTEVGKSSAAASAGQSALVSAVERKRNTWTHGSSKYYSAVVTFNAGSLGAPVTIWESGLFSRSASAGVMLNRKKFTGVAIGTGDKLTVQWKITFTQA